MLLLDNASSWTVSRSSQKQGGRTEEFLIFSQLWISLRKLLITSMSLSYFDEIFFSHFIKQEGDEVLDICHKHIVTIIDTVMVWMFF